VPQPDGHWDPQQRGTPARPTVTTAVPAAPRLPLSTFPAMDTICSGPIPPNPISSSPLRPRQRPRVHLSRTNSVSGHRVLLIFYRSRLQRHSRAAAVCVYVSPTQNKSPGSLPGPGCRGSPQSSALPHRQSPLPSPIFFPLFIKKQKSITFPRRKIKRKAGRKRYSRARTGDGAPKSPPFHLHLATSKSPAREIFASAGLAQARGWTEVFGVECYSPGEPGAWHAVSRHPAPGPAAKLCHGNPAARRGLGGSRWVEAIKLLLWSWFRVGSFPLPRHGLLPARQPGCSQLITVLAGATCHALVSL